MSADDSPSGGSGGRIRKGFLSQFNNWISASGAVIAMGALFAFVLLFFLDITAEDPSPYLGILTFLVAPFFLVSGLVFMLIGWLVDRWYLSKLGHRSTFLRFSLDFSKPGELRKFLIFGALAVGFLFLSALGSYKTYHVTEGNEFCGEVCHTIMEPEYTTYQKSPHARVACVDCHIGEGATWYVKAKIDGLYQVYATLANIYPTPVPTPIESLRPSQDTCEKCHWPQVFTGNLDRTFEHYLSDEDNTPYSIRLILKVGGGDPRLGRVGGIHWHTDPRNRVEYVALDEDRQDVPMVRLRKENGEEVVFLREDYDTVEDLEEALAGEEHHEVRVMDCIDCHNRPAHILLAPNQALDNAFALKRLDPSWPELKYNAVELLVGEYETVEQAHATIRASLLKTYAGQPRLEETITEVQRIYSENFFPLMKADWSVYPNNIGHKNWGGCFRCHGGEHYNVETGAPLQAADCNSCHTILAQGVGDQLLQLAPAGLAFEHPAGDVEGLQCNLCHTGGPQ
ncbi:MAG: cytochrome c3 family protein [Oceanipulchritudo sp.]